MKIYPKNRIYITFPDPPDEQTDGWLIGGTLYTREEPRQNQPRIKGIRKNHQQTTGKQAPQTDQTTHRCQLKEQGNSPISKSNRKSLIL
jgi:hypothetical protein